MSNDNPLSQFQDEPRAESPGEETQRLGTLAGQALELRISGLHLTAKQKDALVTITGAALDHMRIKYPETLAMLRSIAAEYGIK